MGVTEEKIARAQKKVEDEAPSSWDCSKKEQSCVVWIVPKRFGGGWWLEWGANMRLEKVFREGG